jgi:hypothetical protein
MAQTPDKPKSKGTRPGRPSIFNQTIGDRICEIVATNPMGLKALHRKYPEMPNETVVNEWRYKNPSFGMQYAKAKQLQAELLVEEILDISDDISHDIVVGKNGVEQLNTEYVARSRLRVDSRKWLASKLAPKIYGDKQIIEQTTSENESLRAELAALRAQLAEKNKSDY